MQEVWLQHLIQLEQSIAISDLHKFKTTWIGRLLYWMIITPGLHFTCKMEFLKEKKVKEKVHSVSLSYLISQTQVKEPLLASCNFQLANSYRGLYFINPSLLDVTNAFLRKLPEVSFTAQRKEKKLHRSPPNGDSLTMISNFLF